MLILISLKNKNYHSRMLLAHIMEVENRNGKNNE